MASGSRSDVEKELRKAIEVEGEKELTIALRKHTAEVVEYAKTISPFDPDDNNAVHFRDSWRMRPRRGRGKLPSQRVDNTDPIARIVENGSNFRPQGGDSPAHHTFLLTAARFGGTVDGVGGASSEDGEL